MEHERIQRQNCWIPALVGLGFGIIEALLWIAGLITGIRFIIPYAAADALLILELKTIIALVVRSSRIRFVCE